MTTQWAQAALDRLWERVEVTADRVGERFPLYADTTTGEWTTTRRGSWTGGFWAGLLALRAIATDSAAHRRQADAAWARLQQWREKDTSCRGLIFWYGSLEGRAGTATDVVSGAHALAEAFEPELGVVPWGGAFGDVREMARVDGVAGLVPLLGWAARRSDSAALCPVAEGHLRRHLELCFAEDTVQPALVRTDGGRWRPQGPPGTGWVRGMAWLLLGCVDGARWLSPEFLKPALDMAMVWQARYGVTVPLADAEHPGGPVDSSAAAITSLALLKLAVVSGDQQWWRAGTTLLRHTLHECQVREGPARGGLAHGCYQLESGVATDHELVWGDFFTALGLGLATGLLSA